MSWPFSLGETLDGILTFATLITIIFTAIAAQSAAVSAKITKEQFVLNKEQYERQLLPRLLPIVQIYSRERIAIESSFDSYEDIDNGLGDLNVQITNVGIGDAYSLQASMVITNYGEIEKSGQILSPLTYSMLSGQGYTLNFETAENTNYLRLESGKMQSGLPFEHVFYINDYINHQTVLHSKEVFTINISSYFQILLLDYVYRSLDYKGRPIPEVEPVIELFISYKKEEQLSTSEYVVNKYKVEIKDADIDNYGRVSFRLDYILI